MRCNLYQRFAAVFTLFLAGCSPEAERVVCWEKSTNKAVAAHVMMSRFETIYVYLDDNDLEQRITPKNSHLWRCVRQGDG